MRKKVLHVSAGGLGYDGVGTVILSIIESLYNEFDFNCVVFNKVHERETSFNKYAKLHRIKCYPTGGKREYKELIGRPFNLYRGIRDICRREQIDVIHCHNQNDAWVCLLAAKHEHVPIRIVHTHVTKSTKKRSFVENAYKRLCRFIINRVATSFVGCSKVACIEFFDSNNYIVAPNSIDLTKYNPVNRIPHSGLNFIHVGRFNHAKNQEFVIETFSKICKKRQDVHLYLVGHGPKDVTEKLNRQIETLGISTYVDIIPGDKEDVFDYYAKSDYMIFPSRYEGFGIALLEAQAMGIHCFVSENIQPEADFGLIDFLNLSDGSEHWARYICKAIDNHNTKTLNIEKLLKYGNDAVGDIYRNLYNSK